MSMDEFKQIMQFVAALPKPEKGIIALVDAAKAGRQDPAVIKDSGLKEYTRGHRATVYFNARFHHRTLIGIFQRVGRLLNLTSTSVPMMFFDSEAEARAWIDEQRTGAEPSL